LGFSLRIVTFVEIKESHIFMGQTTPRIVLESCFEKRSRSGGIMSPEVESAEFRFGFRGCSHADSEILFADLRRAFDHSGGEHLTYRAITRGGVPKVSVGCESFINILRIAEHLFEGVLLIHSLL